MPYNYDYFISYAHTDNQSEDGKSGFVDEFVDKLQNSTEHQQMFGGKINVFFDKTEIHSMSDWDNCIRSNLASSRFLIVLLSPGYFKSEYCAREFDWWMQHEMHRCVLGEGTAPVLIVDVAKIYDFQAETIPSIPKELQTRFPNWLSQIRKIQSGPKFDIHNLDRAKIGDVLDSLREEVKDRVRRQEAAEQSPHTGHYPAYNEYFVGRRENLRSLRKSLSEQSESVYCALTGLGGFGKTELALTYGHAFAWDYGLGRVFAKCENKTSISEAILTSGIAEMHGWELPEGSEEQKITFLYNRLNEKRKEIVKRNAEEGNLKTLGTYILLILDNVNKRTLISKNSLSILPNFFHVIITTRLNTNDISYIHTESVERLSEDESVELLCNLHPFSNPDEAKAARDIAKLMAGFTLAVELTGAYLENNKYITYQKQYERLFSNHAETFQKMADKTGDLTRHAAETVAAVLESTLSALPDNARKVLDFASVMPPDTVALGWLPELCGLDEEEGDEAIAYLTGYSLLTPLESEPNIARMHHLVAETVKQEIPDETTDVIIDKILGKCKDLLHKDKTFWCSPENSWNITPIFEFCLTITGNWTIESSEDEIFWKITEMLSDAGNILRPLGKLNEARKVFLRSIKISKKRIKKFPSNIQAKLTLFSSYEGLAILETIMGKTSNARSRHKKAIKIISQLPDSISTDSVISFMLSNAYSELGNLEMLAENLTEAREWFEKALDFALQSNNTLSEELPHLQLLSMVYEQLGFLDKTAGNIADARKWYEKALDIVPQMIDKTPNDFSKQVVLSNLYSYLGELDKIVGNLDSAREWYEKALEIRQHLAQTMPEDVQIQQFLSYSYGCIGDLECTAGNLTAVREFYEKALNINQRIVNVTPDNILSPLLSACYKQFGILEKDVGNANAARAWFEKALDFEKRLVETIPESNMQSSLNLIISYNLLGNLEMDAGNASAAREWYEKAMGIILLGDGKRSNDIIAQHWYIISYNNLGDLEIAEGNTTVARDFYQKALEISQRHVDKMPENVSAQRDLSECYSNLVNLEIAVNNASVAKEWSNKALTILNQLVQTMSYDVETQKILGKVYRCLGDSEKASGNYTKALDWYKKSMSTFQQLIDKMPKNVKFKQDLYTLYNRLGDLEDAAGNEDAALEWRKKEKEIHQSLTDNIPD